MSNPFQPERRRLFWPAILGASSVQWRPAADVYRAGQEWIVKFELAGVRSEEVEILAQGRRLTVRGSRRDWAAIEGATAQLMEIAYSRFERSVELPCELDRAEIVRQYRDGMLLIAIRLRGVEP